MGPRTSSFPVRSLSILTLAAIAALASGCASYSRPYGYSGGHHGGYGSSGCRSSWYGGCGSSYQGSYRRHQTVYVPVYRNVPRHSHDGRSRHWERGWADDDRRDRDHQSHRDRNRNRGPQRERNEDRRVGPPPQAQPQQQQRQRIANPRVESTRARSERKVSTGEAWRAERARRGGNGTDSRARDAWLESRERP